MKNKVNMTIEEYDKQIAAAKEIGAGEYRLSLQKQAIADYKADVEKILDSIKVGSPVEEKEYGNLSKRQVFELGQANVLFRLKEKLAILKED